MSKLELLTNEPSWNIAPKAAFCVKTSQFFAKEGKSEENKKVFINICVSEDLPAPEKLIDEQELASILESSDPGSYRIPISLGDPHEESDKKGQPCTAYDVILNSTFYEQRVRESDLFQTFVVVVAMDAICDKYGLQLDRHNWVKLKNKKQMGEIRRQRVRQKAKPLIEEIGDFPTTSVVDESFYKDAQDKNRPSSSSFAEYKFWKDKFRNTSSILGEFRFKATCVVANSSLIDLYISSQRISLKIPQQEQSLDLYIPFPLDVDNAIARFDVEKQVLFVELPLLRRDSPNS